METTKALLNQLYEVLAARYEAQLAQFGAPRNIAIRREREALIVGYKDGLRHGMREVCNMLDVTVKE